MAKRERLLRYNDGSIETAKSKYNGKYLFGNLLVCGDCGASYRRRTERGKILWRCATRVEKGKSECGCSLTINEEWIKDILGKEICGGSYDEYFIRTHVQKIEIYCERIVVLDIDKNEFEVGIFYKRNINTLN